MNDCWEWQGAIGTHGYGTIGQDLAHRVVYEICVGPIPCGYEIDHLCRNRPCCRPSHLEAVTQQENLLRVADTITHCPQGHEYTEANTRIQKTHKGRPTVWRKCRACHRDESRKARRQAA